MAVTIADITKLRKLTGAGLADCKKALEESDNNIDAAIEIIRAKGQAVAAKRSDRDASEGCVLAKYENGFAAIIALKCETDFVANNADFVKLTRDILDLAVANKCKDLEEENPYWEPFSTLTEWVCPVFTSERCAYIDTNNNPEELITKLVDMGVMSKTGYAVQSGYCTYPEYEFDSEWLESLKN